MVSAIEECCDYAGQYGVHIACAPAAGAPLGTPLAEFGEHGVYHRLGIAGLPAAGKGKECDRREHGGKNQTHLFQSPMAACAWPENARCAGMLLDTCGLTIDGGKAVRPEKAAGREMRQGDGARSSCPLAEKDINSAFMARSWQCRISQPRARCVTIALAGAIDYLDR